ncbi:MAG: hypothetical protein KF789_09680 [Bdellovibrionaceae bacterium]|nr:hypothetical protein [Pseudobdellovibrionaceae bacterium]
MNKILIISCLLVSSVSFAQRQKRTVASNGTKVATVGIGMTSSALNIGGRMEFGSEQGAFGGSAFLQTKKEDAGIQQVLSFGGHSLIKLIDAELAAAYMAPGVGLAMISGVRGQDDKTVVGPSFRFGGQLKLTNGASIGLERFEVWNWFDSKAPSSAAYTSAVYTFAF